jgi:hypothetical protein
MEIIEDPFLFDCGCILNIAFATVDAEIFGFDELQAG